MPLYDCAADGECVVAVGVGVAGVVAVVGYDGGGGIVAVVLA